MTTRNHARPVRDRTSSRRSNGGPPPGLGGPALSERLAAARERKGVDLYRAERDTKIRARYLAALERGDERDLPGTVYTKGFLRNYAIYLGLDPDEILAQWHAEHGDPRAPLTEIAGPRPLSAPRPGLTFSPGILVAVLMTIAVVAFFGYLGVQLLRFAKPPTIAVSVPAAAVTEVDETTTEFTFRGTSIAGATIEIAATGREQPYRVSADEDGAWTAVVDVSRGQNQFEVNAKDPETGKVAETPVQRVIVVPFPEILAPTLTIDSPEDGATFENGAIPVTGRTTNATSVNVQAIYLAAPGEPIPSPVASPSPAPAPSAEPSPSVAASPVPSGEASPSPGPDGSPAPDGTEPGGTTIEPEADGSFAVPLELTSGQWRIVVTATSAEGKTVSLDRGVTISYTGVTLVVTIEGNAAWLKVWVDGALDPTIGAAGQTVRPGRSLTFTGDESVEVRTGNSGGTLFTLNGEPLGALGRSGVPETWLFAPPDPPVQTNRR
jgi:cytoskeletal protein RodZ